MDFIRESIFLNGIRWRRMLWRWKKPHIRSFHSSALYGVLPQYGTSKIPLHAALNPKGAVECGPPSQGGALGGKWGWSRCGLKWPSFGCLIPLLWRLPIPFELHAHCFISGRWSRFTIDDTPEFKSLELWYIIYVDNDNSECHFRHSSCSRLIYLFQKFFIINFSWFPRLYRVPWSRWSQTKN